MQIEPQLERAFNHNISGAATFEVGRVYHRRNDIHAPFARPDGSPYLEPHHTRRVSDGGPDHPRYVGGICPTCHKEIHYGANGAERNSRLLQYLSSLER